MENQGVVLLGALAVAVVGLLITMWLINAFLNSTPKSQRQRPKHFPTGPRAADPQDKVPYNKINVLATFFVAKMKEKGYPGLSAQQLRPFSPSRTMRQLAPNQTHVPIEITIANKAWWGGSRNYCSITPDGQWEYFGICTSYREGSMNEFEAWWVVSSRHFKKSVAARDPYPFNLYLVLEEGDATLRHAYTDMARMMGNLLQRYAPQAIPEFRVLLSR